MRSDLGTIESRLQYAVFNVLNISENTTEDRPRIEEADYSIESANLTKTQLLQEPGTAMLAQANILPASALQLIG